MDETHPANLINTNDLKMLITNGYTLVLGLAEPSQVEKDFIAAEEELLKIAGARPK